MKRPLHFFALLLFALTQFVAPFAHAHVSGPHDNEPLHTSEIPHHLSLPGLYHCHIESPESLAIGLQLNYQRDNAASIPPSPVSTLQCLPVSSWACPSCGYEPPSITTLAFEKPLPQAPPA